MVAGSFSTGLEVMVLNFHGCGQLFFPLPCYVCRTSILYLVSSYHSLVLSLSSSFPPSVLAQSSEAQVRGMMIALLLLVPFQEGLPSKQST